MANLLARFNLTSKTRTQTVTYTDYISKKNPLGDFKKIENLDVIMNSWNNILLTPRGTYDHDPEYGSGLYDLIFNPADSDTKREIINEIYQSLYKYDDRASIENIQVKFLKSNQQKGFLVDIQVNYKGEIKNLTIELKDTAQ